MRAFVLEGDPKEVAEALKALGVSSLSASGALVAPPAVPETSGDSDGEAGDENESIAIPTPVARKVMNRRSLAPLQKQMLVEIYDAGDKGILGSKLAKKLGYDQAQFRGMMGAWGRRLSNTPGYDGEGYFFAYEWDYDNGSYRYSLPESVREAVRIEVVERK